MLPKEYLNKTGEYRNFMIIHAFESYSLPSHARGMAEGTDRLKLPPPRVFRGPTKSGQKWYLPLSDTHPGEGEVLTFVQPLPTPGANIFLL